MLRSIVLACAVPFSLIRAQPHRIPIRVAVAIQDSTVGGVISSTVRAALRNLGDVALVQPSERPRFIVKGLVLCGSSDGRCAQESFFTFTLRVVTPLTESILSAVVSAPQFTPTDSALWRMTGHLSEYVMEGPEWIARFGRGTYDSEIRTIVAELDAKCFEDERQMERLMKMPQDQFLRALNERTINEIRTGVRLGC